MIVTPLRRVRYLLLFAWCKLRRHKCYWDRGSHACDECNILSLEQFSEKYIRPMVEADVARFEKEYAAWVEEVLKND